MSDLAFSMLSAFIIISTACLWITYVMSKEDQDDV